MKMQIKTIILLYMAALICYGQQNDGLFNDDLLLKQKIAGKLLLDQEDRYIIHQEDSPIKLEKIELIANSAGVLTTPQFIYKGEVDEQAAPLVVDLSAFSALINDADYSSISPDDGGQFYVSQAFDVRLIGMLRSIDYIENISYELRFGADDEGLALEYMGSGGIFEVPFTAWDLNGTPDDRLDDIQIIPNIYTLDGDTSWGIKGGNYSPWELNVAEESDVIYLHYPQTSYADFVQAYREQVATNQVDPDIYYKHLRDMIFRRITINSLEANPLSTINMLNDLPRPKPGTVIRWTFQIASYAPRVLTRTPVYGAIGDELYYYARINSYPRPTFNLVMAPAGMTINSSGVLDWTPTDGYEGKQQITVEASNAQGSIQEDLDMWIDTYPWEGKNHNNNNVECTVFNSSYVGWVNTSPWGDGFIYKDINGLYSGQLFVAQSDSQISGYCYSGKTYNHYATLSQVVSVPSQINYFDQAFRSEYDDRRAEKPLGIKIIQHSYSKSTAPDDDYIIMDYEIVNTNTELLNGIYIALFMDWDVGDYNLNLAGYDATRQLSYMFESGEVTNPYHYGVALLTGEVSGHTISPNFADNSELFNQMHEIAALPSDPSEYNALLTTDPYDIPAGDAVRVVFAILGGDSESDLQSNADAAHAVNLNRVPVVENTIEDQTLAVGGYIYERDLNAEPLVFMDHDKDNLSYGAESSNSVVASANVSGSVLTITPLAQGNSTIIVTADDGHEGVNTTSFEVSIIAGPSISTGSASNVTAVSATVNGTINPNGYATHVCFEYGESTGYGDTIWADQTPVSGTSTQSVTAAIADLNVETNYHYRLIAQNDLIKVEGSDQQFTTAAYPANISLSYSLTFPIRSNASDYLSTDYRIIGIPGESTDRTIKDLLSGLQDIDWQVYWDNGAAVNYLVEFDGGDSFQLKAGRAFWLIHKGTWSIDLSVPSAALNNEDQVEITLHNGWNLITNPFNVSIAWTDVQQANSVTRPIFYFAGTSSWQQPTSFEPYKGYYFFNESDLSVLKIPYKLLFSKPEIEQDITWLVRITMKSELVEDGLTYFGISERAEKDLDDLDFRKPRATGPIPTVFFPHPEWDRRYSSFARDIRPPIEDIEIWEFSVYAGAMKKIQLSFSAIEEVPDELDIVLLNCEKLDYLDLCKQAEYSFKPVKKNSCFKILVGSREYVQDEINKYIPTEFDLGTNFPNPFNPSTTIPVSIPSKATVSLKVYNLLGQEVNTLFEGVLDIGRHYFSWDGSNYADVKLPSGMYICRLTTPTGMSIARKMVYIK
ncbi:MAG: hypothetical protein AMS26_12780 [Bacteroides sp. SM23_62]|nr:MAG: hypothetical protein AMS26_12780 [Bacteroides sp. SM23_62]